LVIFPLSKDAGLSISATSAGAPKDARKALEKGVSEAKKQKFEQAEKELKKAVGLHPKYAEAWTELGKVYVAKKDLEAARAALQQALEADSKYVYPYEELYKIAFEQTNWQELADTTNKLLRLNPYEFPAAYYYNGVANLQLKNLDEAQRSLERALDADKRLSNPKALYVMGLVLIQKREYQGAMDVLADFTRVAPNDSTAPKAKALIDELQKIR
jgi:tetratricopeptide (TPR) repeat protein